MDVGDKEEQEEEEERPKVSVVTGRESRMLLFCFVVIFLVTLEFSKTNSTFALYWVSIK